MSAIELDSWESDNFENAYKNWMVGKMDAKSYTILFDYLYDVEFWWNPDIPRDSDRASDGKYLRNRFSEETGMPVPWDVAHMSCSFLEFAIALAYSIDEKIMYDPEGIHDPSNWFWLMMENAELDEFTDDRCLSGGVLAHEYIAERVNAIMFRRYGENGYPGFFPLRKPSVDQRNVEIWYQLNAYFIENYFS